MSYNTWGHTININELCTLIVRCELCESKLSKLGNIIPEKVHQNSYTKVDRKLSNLNIHKTFKYATLKYIDFPYSH